MIVGIYYKNGSATVGPLERVAQLAKITEYELRQMLDGKKRSDKFIVVKLPAGSVWRM